MTPQEEEKYNNLLGRIVKGAEYIDSLSRYDPKYEPAMKKFDSLCEEALRLRWGKWPIT